MTEERAVDRVQDPHMHAAIAVARRGLAAGEPPVGACLVRGDEVIVTLNNAVISELDATAHAEMRVIREACRRLRTLELRDCTLYATVEPCLMCLSACHYAGIDRVVYGASLADMHAVTGAELTVAPDDLVRGGLRVVVSGQCLADECRALLDDWARGFGPPDRSHTDASS
jgi:tRNA(Arg) A34 adenosine deaminase TadA